MNDVAPEPSLTQGLGDVAPQPSSTQEPGDVAPQPSLTQGPGDVAPQPGLTQGLGDVAPQPSLTQGPGDVAPQPGLTQGLGDVAPQPSSTQEINDLVSQQIGALFPETRDFDVTLPSENEQPSPFGDTNISTTGPVFTGPVNVKQTLVIQRPHGEEPLLARNARPLDAQLEETTPKMPPSPLQRDPPSASTQNSTINHGPANVQSPGICDRLQKSLKEAAEERANDESSLADFVKKPITPVNLSVVSKPQQIDDKFGTDNYYRSREDLERVYERPTGDITSEQLFDRSKQTARDEADKKFKPRQERKKRNYVEQHGNVVAVLGRPGIGKTISSKKWALQALAGELCGNVTFFFYIVIRFVDFTKTTSLLQFLLSTILPDFELTAREAKVIMKALVNDPNVLIIFDGLDEAAFESFNTEAPTVALESREKAEVFLKHLLGGKLLPRARKIVTSRPAPFYKLHPSHRPRFQVEILGLTPNSQKELGQQICGTRYQTIQEKLSKNEGLFAYCYVPVNFILTVHYLMNYDGDIQFVTLTRVLAFTCVQYSQTEHLKGQQCEFVKLAKMAWDGLVKQKVVFNWEDFKEAKIAETTANAFLNASITKKGNLNLTILNGHKLRYFSHLIWQEFFAAVYLMMIMEKYEFKSHRSRLSDDRWEVVSKFVFGLCDGDAFDELRAVVPGCSRDDWDDKKVLLRNFASVWVEDQTKEAMVRSCSWAHEANDEELTSTVSSLLPDEIDLSRYSLHPPDIENLTEVLQIRKRKKLNLSHNNIGDSGAALVARCIHNFDEVNLSHCGVRSHGVESLSNKIKDLPAPLRSLDLSWNTLTYGSEALASCVHKINVLRLCNCHLTLADEELIKSKSKGKVVFDPEVQDGSSFLERFCWML